MIAITAMQFRQYRYWRNCIAVIAIMICLVLVLVPLTQPAAIAVLVLITFLILTLNPSPELLSRLAYLRLGDIPDAPALPQSFQRPPPLRLL